MLANTLLLKPSFVQPEKIIGEAIEKILECCPARGFEHGREIDTTGLFVSGFFLTLDPRGGGQAGPPKEKKPCLCTLHHDLF